MIPEKLHFKWPSSVLFTKLFSNGSLNTVAKLYATTTKIPHSMFIITLSTPLVHKQITLPIMTDIAHRYCWIIETTVASNIGSALIALGN